MIEIVPAIIAKSFEELDEKVKIVDPYVSRAQIDIMDGEFVSNQTINGYDELKNLNSNLKFEVHLMVNHPEDYIKKLIDTGRVDKYVLHIESSGDLDSLIELIHDNGYQVGLSLNPETQNDALIDYVDKIDFVQYMTVDPGFYGSPFMENVLDKMSDLHFMHPEMSLQVDGGINEETASKAVQAGATTLVSGSYLFNHDDIAEAIKSLQ